MPPPPSLPLRLNLIIYIWEYTEDVLWYWTKLIIHCSVEHYGQSRVLLWEMACFLSEWQILKKRVIDCLIFSEGYNFIPLFSLFFISLWWKIQNWNQLAYSVNLLQRKWFQNMMDWKLYSLIYFLRPVDFYVLYLICIYISYMHDSILWNNNLI